MEVVQITRYELISFINTTKIIMNGIKEELRGLRLTALQNRIVLDQILAARGGVCAMVGETYCTHIPENDEDGSCNFRRDQELDLHVKDSDR